MKKLQNTKMKQYGILVNTSDGFEDCWDPYFKLHKKYWPDCTSRIYLNTENKDYSYPGLEITTLKVAAEHPGRRLAWGECLLRALKEIDEDIVLYMQEDYFFKAPVKNDLIEKYYHLMQQNDSIHCIHLTDQGPYGDVKSNIDESITEISRVHRYRVSCQAALWKKDILIQYLRHYESGWDFELYGSKRAAVLNHNFYAVNRSLVKLDQFEIIPYIFTGIIRGRWYKKVVDLFKANEIKINYDIRGFYPPRKKTLYERVVSKFKSIPIIIRCNADLITLRVKNIL